MYKQCGFFNYHSALGFFLLLLLLGDLCAPSMYYFVFPLEEFITYPFQATDITASKKTIFLSILIKKTRVKEGGLTLFVYCFHLLHHQLESLQQNI